MGGNRIDKSALVYQNKGKKRGQEMRGKGEQRRREEGKKI